MPISEKLKKTLEEKGWETKDIEKAMNIMENSPTYNKEKESKIGAILYWMTLFLIIIGNLLLSVVLVPILLVMTGFTLYLMVASVALVWGLLFNVVLRDIQEINTSQHIIAEIFIPFIAIFNVYIIANLASGVEKVLKLSQLNQNPAIIGGIYVFAFMLPFLFTRIKDQIKERKRRSQAK
jgi:hypothetical protein